MLLISDMKRYVRENQKEASEKINGAIPQRTALWGQVVLRTAKVTVLV